MSRFGSIPFSLEPDKLGFPLSSAERKTTIFRNYKVGPVLDQGDLGACTGYSLAALLAAEPIVQKVDPKKIYNEARKLDNTPENVEGAKINMAVDYLVKQGLVKKEFWTMRTEEVAIYLNTISPCILSIPWYSNMDNPAKDGRVIPRGNVIGFHSILAFAYDGLKKKIFLRNSWGKNWGDEGNCYLTFGDLEKLMKNGLACALVE